MRCGPEYGPRAAWSQTAGALGLLLAATSLLPEANAQGAEPPPHSRRALRSARTGVDLANVKMLMNPFDEILVEEALRLREMG